MMVDGLTPPDPAHQTVSLVSFTMEPSDFSFARGYDFLDHEGNRLEPLLVSPESSVKGLGASTRSRRSLLSSGSRHTRHIRSPSNFSAFSENTLVQSVLLAEGLVHVEDDETLQVLPQRFKEGSVKAKITWFGSLCLAGIGMFVEAYVIITTGQIKTVWHYNYPECWDSENDQNCPNNIQCCGLFPNTPDDVCSATIPNEVCTDNNEYPSNVLCTSRQLGAVSSAEFAGIMTGMLVFGWVADRFGRKKAGSLTALLMIVGIGAMTFFDTPSGNVSALFLVFSIAFAIFGFGVGGEYPLTATAAAEGHAESAEDAMWDDEERRHHRLLMERAKTTRRGETISLVFSMQGIGAVVGSVFLLSLIYFSNQTRVDCDKASSNSRGNDPDAVEGIWRSFYFIGLIFVLMLFVYRALVLEEGDGYATVLVRRLKREERLGKEATKKLRWKTFQFYLPRLVGTGGNWFVWDVAFYGLKLFSGPIFEDINPGGDLVVQNGYLLLNNLIALAGYYVVARLIDRPSIGRKKIQMFSFAMCAVLFMATAAVFNSASTSVVIFLYFASSFFGQGANVTTYVVAAEMFPTELRATFHGISAFLGKLGALLATIAFGFMATEDIFWACGGCALTGLVFTFLFTADISNVSLAEHDAQLELFLAGRLSRYKGKLNAPKHLSYFEKWLGRSGEYDPAWVHKLVKDERHKIVQQPITDSLIEILEDQVGETVSATQGGGLPMDGQDDVMKLH